MARKIETGEITIGTAGAVASLTSLKKELKSVQQELAGLEEGSDAFVEMSKKAGELRDRLKDVSEATNAQAGPAFERLGNNVGLLKNDLSNLDFSGAAGKIRGLAGTIKDVKFSDFTGGIKQAGQALVGLGKAILETPLGWIVAGIAAVVGALALWKASVLDVNDALEEQAELNKKIVEQELSDVEAVEGKTEQLKLQGKTQREILEIKKQETAEAIAALETQLFTQQQIKKEQVESAQRNKDILSGILDFLTTPIRALLGIVDQIGSALGKDLGLEKGFESLNDSTANLLFDPEEIAKENDETIKETTKTLDRLKEQRAGYENQINDIGRQAAEKRRAQLEKEAAEELAILTKAKKEVDDLYVNAITDAGEREKAKLKLTLDRTLAEIDLEIAKVDKESEAQRLLLEEKRLLNEQYEREITRIATEESAKRSELDKKLAGDDINELEKQFAAEASLIQKQVTELQNAATSAKDSIGGPGSLTEQTLQALQALRDATLGSTSAATQAFDQANAINAERYEQGLVDLETFESQKAAIRAQYDEQLLAAQSEAAAKELEIVAKSEESKAQKRQETVGKIGAGLSSLSNLSKALEEAALAKAGDDEKKKLAIQKRAFQRNKALQIAQTIMSTYESATQAFNSLAGIPVVGPTLGGVAAGIAVATGLANVARIKNSTFEGGESSASSSAGSSSSSGLASVPSPPNPQPVAFNSDAVGQASGQTGSAQQGPQSQQPPIRVVVTETDITSTQTRVNRLLQRATVG